MKSSFRKTLAAAAAIALIVIAIASLKYISARPPSDRLVLSGTIEADDIQIGSRVGGRVASVLADEGQEVKQGQPILRFEAFDLEARRADAAAAVGQAEASLAKMKNWSRPEEMAQAKAAAEAAWMNLEQARNGPRPQEIEAARADLKAADADLELARVTAQRVESLVKAGDLSQQEYDNAKASLDRARARRDAFRQRLDVLLAGTRKEELDRAERLFREAQARNDLVQRGARKEDIDAAQAQLDRARAALKQIDTQLSELEVKSPSDAFIEVMRVRPGDLIAQGASVATLIEVDRLFVRVYVPEPEVGHLRLGKETTVSVDTFRGEAFKGEIEHIASRGEFTPRNVQTREERNHQMFGVRVRLDNSARKLRPGMAADVTVMK